MPRARAVRGPRNEARRFVSAAAPRELRRAENARDVGSGRCVSSRAERRVDCIRAGCRSAPPRLRVRDRGRAPRGQRRRGFARGGVLGGLARVARNRQEVFKDARVLPHQRRERRARRKPHEALQAKRARAMPRGRPPRRRRRQRRELPQERHRPAFFVRGRTRAGHAREGRGRVSGAVRRDDKARARGESSVPSAPRLGRARPHIERQGQGRREIAVPRVTRGQNSKPSLGDAQEDVS